MIRRDAAEATPLFPRGFCRKKKKKGEMKDSMTIWKKSGCSFVD